MLSGSSIHCPLLKPRFSGSSMWTLPWEALDQPGSLGLHGSGLHGSSFNSAGAVALVGALSGGPRLPVPFLRSEGPGLVSSPFPWLILAGLCSCKGPNAVPKAGVARLLLPDSGPCPGRHRCSPEPVPGLPLGPDPRHLLGYFLSLTDPGKHCIPSVHPGPDCGFYHRVFFTVLMVSEVGGSSSESGLSLRPLVLCSGFQVTVWRCPLCLAQARAHEVSSMTLYPQVMEPVPLCRGAASGAPGFLSDPCSCTSCSDPHLLGFLGWGSALSVTAACRVHP